MSRRLARIIQGIEFVGREAFVKPLSISAAQRATDHVSRAARGEMNTDSLRIREATPDDVDAVAALCSAAFEPLRAIYRPTPEVAARQPQRAREGTRLVAELERRIVATVQFDSHAEHVHVIGLAVHPHFQRLGIARHLLDWIVAHAPTLGHRVVVLDTIRETGNVALFEKLGFRVFDETVTQCFVSDRYQVLHEVKMHRFVQ